MMNKKPTKKENFLEIVEFLENAGKTEMAEIIRHEIELIDKKASNSKMNATQTENIKIKEMIINELIKIGRNVTITELIKESQAINDAELSNQKISALMTQLKNEGKVERIADGKKATFKVID